MSSVQTAPYNAQYASDSDDGQATGGRRSMIQSQVQTAQVPNNGSLSEPAGKLIKMPSDKPSFMIGIKLDIEAEIHLTARIRGDITIGLY